MTKEYGLLDGNVIAYWIVNKRILPWLIKEHLGMSEELIKTYEKRYNSSVKLIDWILSKSEKNIKFCTYELNVSEIFNAVKEEVKTVFLFAKGQPISIWVDRRIHEQIKMEDEELKMIYNLTMESFDQLFANGKIEIWEIPQIDVSYQLDIFSFLLLHMPDLKTHDGLILTGCLIDRIKFLVTNGGGLTKKDEFLKKDFEHIFKDNPLRIISPEKAPQKVNKSG